MQIKNLKLNRFQSLKSSKNKKKFGIPLRNKPKRWFSTSFFGGNNYPGGQSCWKHKRKTDANFFFEKEDFFFSNRTAVYHQKNFGGKLKRTVPNFPMLWHHRF